MNILHPRRAFPLALLLGLGLIAGVPNLAAQEATAPAAPTAQTTPAAAPEPAPAPAPAAPAPAASAARGDAPAAEAPDKPLWKSPIVWGAFSVVLLIGLVLFLRGVAQGMKEAQRK